MEGGGNRTPRLWENSGLQGPDKFDTTSIHSPAETNTHGGFGDDRRIQKQTGSIQDDNNQEQKICDKCVTKNWGNQDLKLVVENWDNLTEVVKAGIIAMVKVSKGK